VKDLQVFELNFLDDDLGNFSTTFSQPFHFSCKIGFNSVSYSKLVSEMRDVCHYQSKKRSFHPKTQPGHFVLHKEELAFYPVFDMYMSLAPLISCDLENLAYRDKSRVFSRTAIS
jgi:hypothetical protein